MGNLSIWHAPNVSATANISLWGSRASCFCHLSHSKPYVAGAKLMTLNAQTVFPDWFQGAIGRYNILHRKHFVWCRATSHNNIRRIFWNASLHFVLSKNFVLILSKCCLNTYFVLCVHFFTSWLYINYLLCVKRYFFLFFGECYLFTLWWQEWHFYAKGSNFFARGHFLSLCWCHWLFFNFFKKLWECFKIIECA